MASGGYYRIFPEFVKHVFELTGRTSSRPASLQFTNGLGAIKSVFEKSVLGSTGHWPVPSGDSPDGTGATARAKRHGLFETLLAEVPVGGSPTGAGGSPVPPIFKTGSQ